MRVSRLFPARLIPPTILAMLAGSAAGLSAAAFLPGLPAPGPVPAIPAALASRAAPAAYTVRPGDTLSAIAARSCGSWAGLYAANRRAVGPDPDRIEPGQRLRLACAGPSALPHRAGHAITAHRAGRDRDGDRPGGAYCKPNCWGDGDGDGFDLDHPPGQSAPAHTAARATARRVTTASGTYHGSSNYEACVIRKESGGNARAVNPSSGAGGLYQFLPSTWHSLGYSGSPQNAPVSVQRQAFQQLYAQAGTSPWSPSDGC